MTNVTKLIKTKIKTFDKVIAKIKRCSFVFFMYDLHMHKNA